MTASRHWKVSVLGAPLARLMDRRAFITLVSGGIMAMPRAGAAQQGRKIPRIGLLSGASPDGVVELIEAFKQGMQELGYVEGKITSPKDFRSLRGSSWNERST